MITTPAIAAGIRVSPGSRSGRRAAIQSARSTEPMTIAATTAARARYIRCSLATASIGMMLDVGASVRKNTTPSQAHARRCSVPTAVMASIAMIVSRAGSTCQTEVATGQLE